MSDQKTPSLLDLEGDIYSVRDVSLLVLNMLSDIPPKKALTDDEHNQLIWLAGQLCAMGDRLRDQFKAVHAASTRQD